ncbi:MAG: hypothetical protein BZY80_01595 [SAR202 cluster bacterium Io17-Chloro-G2]|nr:MAG: hypothetical protein BZY80_01595 [SAR202 cluster bacterium Io17-Chloro-G2]
MSDVIELRVPPKLEHQSVARAAIGVIAGGLSFNYDEIIQLRVAVSEAFEIMLRRVERTSPESAPTEVIIRFKTDTDSIEVLIPGWPSIAGYVASEEEAESQALLESLMDEIMLDGGNEGEPVVRMLKRKEALDD